MVHNKSSQEHINVKYRTRNEQIHTICVAETFVPVLCSQLNTVSYIFRNCDLLGLNESHEKKLQPAQVKNNSLFYRLSQWRLNHET